MNTEAIKPSKLDGLVAQPTLVDVDPGQVSKALVAEMESAWLTDWSSIESRIRC